MSGETVLAATLVRPGKYELREYPLPEPAPYGWRTPESPKVRSPPAHRQAPGALPALRQHSGYP